MPDISFYEVTSSVFEKSVCQLIQKCYETGINTFVKTEDENVQELLNKTLWTFSQKVFIAHGSKNDDMPERQPVLISSEENNLNNSKILVCVGAEHSNIEVFDRVLVIFYESSQIQRDLCRALYAKYKKQFGELTYYKQNEKGIWEKKG